ncbi:MAG: hypothetical protein R6W90_16500 [Ignavibacteriaceae bacterium]
MVVIKSTEIQIVRKLNISDYGMNGRLYGCEKSGRYYKEMISACRECCTIINYSVERLTPESESVAELIM